jgi:polyisoprenoid-binding protein YceI
MDNRGPSASSMPFSPAGEIAALDALDALDALAGEPWRLDGSRSTVAFEVPHLWGLGTVRGRFMRYEGTLDLRARPQITLIVDAASLTTGHARRDRRLRSPDFLDAVRHPRITFASRSVREGGDHLEVEGVLSARGARIEVELDLTPAIVAGEPAIVADTFVMHRGLGITWNPTGFTRPYSRLICAGTLVPVAAPAPLQPCAPAGAARCGAHRLPLRARAGATGRRGPRAPREFRQR